MRKFLSIIIPRYKETEKEMFPLLSSINGQVGIDFSDIEVIIATDGTESPELDKNFLGLFEFPVRQVCLEKNSGPGVARQKGLDHAVGEYVMFCDADDTIHNVGVLKALMQEAELTAADMLSSSWLEEILDENSHYIYLEHPQENTWLHGKLLRRQFLIQNSIRFHDTLRVHEDSYFLSIAADLAERNRHMPITSYVWKYHADSITRKNKGAYTYDSMPEFIRACTLAWKEIEKRNPDHLKNKVVQFVLYNYFTYHLPNWQEKEQEPYLKKAERAFAKAITPFWHYWSEAPKELILNAYNSERQRTFHGSMENETLQEWIQKLNIH